MFDTSSMSIPFYYDFDKFVLKFKKQRLACLKMAVIGINLRAWNGQLVVGDVA